MFVAIAFVIVFVLAFSLLAGFSFRASSFGGKHGLSRKEWTSCAVFAAIIAGFIALILGGLWALLSPLWGG